MQPQLIAKEKHCDLGVNRAHHWQYPLAARLAAAALCALVAQSAQAVPLINEFSASIVGTDSVEYVEILGLPNTDYSGYSILEIEGDGTGAGVIDEVITVGTTNASGLWLVSLAPSSLENGTITLLLVLNLNSGGTLGVDLDTNNDGTLDSTLWSLIADGIAVNDGGTDDLTYATTLGVGFDGLPFAPGGASRIPDGVDTDTTSDWLRNDFDLAGILGFAGTIVAGEAYNTPGAPNAAFGAVPEPGTLALLGLGLAGFAATRRRKY